MTDINLKRCAHCDGEAALQFKGGRIHNAYAVWCKDCNIGTAWAGTSEPVVEEWNLRASAPPPAAEPCAHRIADVRNKVVKSGYMCIDCGAVFAAADHDGPRASAAPAVQAAGEAVEYQMRMRAPNGNTGPWHEIQRSFYEQFSAQPDIGDGFSYETRALVVAIQPPPSAKPAPADPRPVVGIVDERYLRPTSGGEE